MPIADVPVKVEGFDLTVRGGESVAGNVALRYIGKPFKLLQGIANADQFDVMVDEKRFDVARAWDLAREMQRDPDVVRAEPMLLTPGIEGTYLTLEAPKEIPPRNWQIDHCSIHHAWTKATAKGAGVVIGHPDTGYMPHSEIWSNDKTENRILHELGFDFLRNDPNPLVPAGGSTHGTATASVIMSGGNEKGVHGAAPAAKLIPLRVDDDVIHWRWGRVRRAVEWATEKKVDIISMSLGGPIDGESLHQAIQRAVADGIIVIAAAGNVWPFVVYPAKYDEVLAVAATNVHRKKWADSARGSAVDVCAPGEDVHRATYDKNGAEVIEHSSGTSYATAVMAGVAALWLSYHGRANLSAKYGASNISRVFRFVVMKHGVRPDSKWDTKHLGAGIVDAERVIDAKLPDLATVSDTVVLEFPASSAPLTAEMVEYFPDIQAEVVKVRLAKLLKTSLADLEGELEKYGNELKLHLAINNEVRGRIGGGVTLETLGAIQPVPMSNGLASRIGA